MSSISSRQPFRPIQFSIRSVLLVMLVVGTFFAGKGIGQHFGNLAYERALEKQREVISLQRELDLRGAELSRREQLLEVKTDFYDEAKRKQDELNRILHELERQENSKGLSQ